MVDKILRSDCIVLDKQLQTKKDVIDYMANHLYHGNYINDKEKFIIDINKREKESPTNMGNLIAIPHAKSSTVKRPVMMYLRTDKDITDNDGQKLRSFFMIAVPESGLDEHLKIISKLATYLMDENLIKNLLSAETPYEILDIFNYKAVESGDSSNNQNKGLIVGITGCPTGIAHTFMAKKALEEAGQELGYEVKIETHGAIGVENKLTKEDIKRAEYVIIACDREVQTSRFIGKKVLQKKVADAKNVSLAKNLIINAENGMAKEIKPGGKTLEDSKEILQGSEKKGIYKHLMNGVSEMIPFVVIGGIGIAIAFMFGIFASDPTHETYNPIAGFFGQLGGDSAFKLFIPILAGFIAKSIAGRQGFAPAMIAGFMAVIGGSGFLGGMVAGFATGYIALGVMKITENLPDVLKGVNAVLICPLLIAFTSGAIMFFVVNTPASWLNEALQSWLQSMSGTNKVLLGAILAGMMASDMGGPINKTASAFGLAMFSSNVFEPSAALMVGGMVPPLAIALAMLIFKNKFTKEERKSALPTAIMGASFITEGAIPFAAADPLRMIPANIIGSCIGGAICMSLDITLMAPHGGIFVIPFACSAPVAYIACILAGTVITTLIIGITKPTIKSGSGEVEVLGA
ncbi:MULTISPECIES: fructose-specific PTS transporter subunit EIIC [unclassified Clostridioides]|uniref:PTS fructose transporter subunit IIABC n=1 Tax=unclassified Clostridioides TaxID=2635829 RepID=UPI001D12159B|nr:PTS sugar transporter subunit IIA [Clostridioides sp. ES-S-0049-03]MCC0656022.1 PTS sugar transporter subunit IIA [Clostridioides sp. ES-S-0123-01]MCC0673714.1 PTS sugar transporter subunit IIA [Clostridioides sp. ES-S-0145-01]MCC0676298.1 PTS sugar transporter subunit IIA [Clostridioides sp. ES-W-0018-02]MCC0680788.1 PTS sugar transporter subunit IIA [Clostridioides sp. ES-S-0005-03]MCC0706455.1 PTS sugar transporter subunit IIA [Clostridioides sp. ES-S-0190-01]MCC0711501.1 PTS sugar tran